MLRKLKRLINNFLAGDWIIQLITLALQNERTFILNFFNILVFLSFFSFKGNQMNLYSKFFVDYLECFS